jgi:hypothetical protein
LQYLAAHQRRFHICGHLVHEVGSFLALSELLPEERLDLGLRASVYFELD